MYPCVNPKTILLMCLYPSVQAKDLALGKTEGYDPEAHEEEPESLSAGISIQNLTKVYDEVILCYVHGYTCCMQDRIMYLCTNEAYTVGECSTCM